jgi:uncharacterized protein YndB with AHSA1/START domain
VIEGSRVVHELVLDAPPDIVFDHFVDPGLLVRWIGISADVVAEPGGRFSFEVMPGQFCEGRFLEIDRPRRLVVTWGWTEPTMGLAPGSSRVEVTLDAQGPGTRLRLVHHDLPDDLPLLHDDGWTAFLARLAAVVSGRPAGDYPVGDPTTRLEELRREARP